jgi:phosphoribosylaminoimidazole-succinocarboxamide synthase
MENSQAIRETKLEGIPLFFRGKVRDIYDLGEELLIVATDRISAFDVVLPTSIPDKGKILTQISLFWFNYLKDIVPNHLITGDVEDFPSQLSPYKEILRDRSMLVKKARRINIESVIRGYLAGSSWKDYQREGKICGIDLPQGLKASDRLPQPIFTPATKAQSGNHDINITEKQLIDNEGAEVSLFLKEKSLAAYKKASDYALSKGIIIADTKFEFGILNDKIILIDEILTPDSSRFWDKESYQPGKPQLSFDKQFVRDYLESLNWDKKPPAPQLPEEIVTKTREKYQQAYQKLVKG